MVKETVKWGHEISHREQSGLLLLHALRLRGVFEKSLSGAGLADEIIDLLSRRSGYEPYIPLIPSRH